MGKLMGSFKLVSQAAFGRVRKELIQVLQNITDLYKKNIFTNLLNLPLQSTLYEPHQVLQVVACK